MSSRLASGAEYILVTLSPPGDHTGPIPQSLLLLWGGLETLQMRSAPTLPFWQEWDKVSVIALMGIQAYQAVGWALLV